MMHINTMTGFAVPTFHILDFSLNPLIIYPRLNHFTICITKTLLLFVRTTAGSFIPLQSLQVLISDMIRKYRAEFKAAKLLTQSNLISPCEFLLPSFVG